MSSSFSRFSTFYSFLRAVLLGSIFGLSASSAWALDLSGLTNKEANAGLKETLNRAASSAVSKLGAADGFLGNPQVKIPLPEGLQKAEQAMRLLGKQAQFEALETNINRAAEAAIPEAKTLLIAAVKSMSIDDAKGILAGGDDAVTQFFKRKTGDQLGQKFLPIVIKATSQVGLAQQYNQVAGKAASLGLVKAEDSKIEDYVTRKALDGLFITLAQEEKAIRQDPVGTGSALLKKIFGH